MSSTKDDISLKKPAAAGDGGDHIQQEQGQEQDNNADGVGDGVLGAGVEKLDMDANQLGAYDAAMEGLRRQPTAFLPPILPSVVSLDHQRSVREIGGTSANSGGGVQQQQAEGGGISLPGSAAPGAAAATASAPQPPAASLAAAAATAAAAGGGGASTGNAHRTNVAALAAVSPSAGAAAGGIAAGSAGSGAGDPMMMLSSPTSAASSTTSSSALSNVITIITHSRGHHELYRALEQLEGLEKEEANLLEHSWLTQFLTEIVVAPAAPYETPREALQKLELLGRAVPRRVCQHPFRKNDIVWVCRTCQADETCVLCHACFSQSDHEGHDVAFYHAQAGGCCDCGDPDGTLLFCLFYS